MIEHGKGISFFGDIVNYSGSELSLKTELVVATIFYY